MTKKTFLFFLVSCCCIQFGWAQSKDSTTFMEARWENKRLARGTRLFKHHFNEKNLFSVNQQISYIEVKSKNKKTFFAIGADEKLLHTTSDFGKAHLALAALNGTFFDVKNGGSVDYVKAAGKVINQNRLEKDNSRTAHQQAAIVIQGAELGIKKWDGTADWEQKLTEPDVMLSGPLLRLDKKDERIDSNAFNTNRHPRTAIGIKPNGSVILLVIDGRNAKSAGASLPELLSIMRWLGCSSAINLDGGGSTTLWVDGFPDDGVINYPTDNQLWDHAGERKVANTILLKKRP